MYVGSTSADPSSWDIAENQTVPYILGIAHPTGFPAFTLAGWLFSHVVAFGSVAWRMNVFSGIWMAACAGGVVLLARTLGAGATEAVLAAFVFAFGIEAYSEGVHADVHAMLIATMIYALVFALRYAVNGRPRDAIVAAAWSGLGLATHPEAMFTLPPLVLALAFRGRPSPRTAMAVLAAVALPLALYLYFPLRSAYVAAHGLDPTAAAPLFGTGTIAWDTSHPRTLDGFIDEVTGRTYNASHALLVALDVRRLPDAAVQWAIQARTEVPIIAIVLAAIGVVAVTLRAWRLALIALTGPAITAAFSYAYITGGTEYGRYLLPTFAVLAAFAAASTSLALPRIPREARRFACIALLAIAIATSWSAERVSLASLGEDNGRRTIDAVRDTIPDGAIVVVPWADATSLAYGAFVERSLGSRIIVVGWPSQYADRYVAWTRTKRVFLFADSHAHDDLLRGLVPNAWLIPAGRGDGRAIIEVHPVLHG